MKRGITLIAFSISIISMVFLFASCSSNDVVMPYSTDEYKSGEWTEESLVKHLEELGFENIEITNALEKYGEEEWKIYNIKIEDPDSNSWFASYREFEKNEEFSKDSKIVVETYVSHSTIKIDSSEVFRELVSNGDISIEDSEISDFFESHDGEYIEFNGVITDCYDSFFYIDYDLDFGVKIENSTWFEYSWEDIKISHLHECGWHTNYNNYSIGTLSKGDNVHMICQIYAFGDYWTLEIKQFETK